jgi:hypothetical protein
VLGFEDDIEASYSGPEGWTGSSSFVVKEASDT